jgi:hypothetical protein
MYLNNEVMSIYSNIQYERIIFKCTILQRWSSFYVIP